MDNETEVTSTVEVMHILGQLIKNRELLTVSFNQGKDSLRTLLLEADPKRGVLVFDGPSDAALVRSIVAAVKLSFAGSLHGARLRFVAAGVKEVSHRGAPALAVKFPASLFRVQNRETFRVKTGNAAACHLPIPGRGNVKVPVNELSVGGVSLQLGHAEDVFRIGQSVPGCRLDLGSVGTVVCTLEVRSLKRTPARLLSLGCRFVGLTQASEALIARFVSQQERGGASRSGLFSL